MNSENPKQYTPEEIAQLEKSRTISDSRLLKEGAEYSLNEKGEKVLIPSQEQKDSIHSRHSYDAVRGLDDKETKERRIEATNLFLEEIGSMINIGGGQIRDFTLLMSHLYQERHGHRIETKNLESLDKEQLNLLRRLKDVIEESDIHKFLLDGIDCRLCFISALEEVDPKIAMHVAKAERQSWE